MTAAVQAPASVSFPAIGTTALLVVTEPDRLAAATEVLRNLLTELDATCSRFRPDSEISRLHATPGRPVPVSPMLAEALGVALRAARTTDGLVDPTVGTAIRALGYDRDFAAVPLHGPTGTPAGPAPGWWRVPFDPTTRMVVLPRGIELDLGATAKAYAADRAAQACAGAVGCGVLVSLGGDLAVAGPAPEPGWLVGVGDDHLTAQRDPDQVVGIRQGGLATSSIVRRAWWRGGRLRHHIVDPRSGEPAEPVWRTVSVAAGSCVDANTAGTAAILLGPAAPGWLTERGLPARLVSVRGVVTTVAGWPAPANDLLAPWTGPTTAAGTAAQVPS